MWIFLLALAIALPGLFVAFLSDDFSLVRAVAERGPFGVWSHSPSDFFRPLISLSVWFDYSVWDMNPVGYHSTNAIAFAVCGYLVYLLAREFVPNGAVVAAVLFLFLPVHAEALYWISGRTDLFATLFFVAALLAHVRGRPGWALCWFTLALLSKESAVVFPFIVLAYDLIVARVERTRRWWLMSVVVPFAILGLFVFVRSQVVGGVIGGYGSHHLDFSVQNAGVNAGIQSAKSFLPSPVLHGAMGYAALSIVLISLSSLFFGSWRTLDKRKVSFCVIAVVLSVLPTVTLRVPLSTTFNDRFVFLASVFAVLLIGVIYGIAPRWRVVPASAIGLVLLGNLGLLSTNWIEASRQARGFLDSVLSFDRPLAIVGVPDNYRGAYVFREGLSDAMALRGFRGEPPLVLARISIFRSPVSVTYDGAFRSAPGGMLLPGDLEPDVARIEDGVLRLAHREGLSGPEIVIYDGGVLVTPK